MHIAPLRPLLTASLIAALVAVSGPARPQPAPSASASSPMSGASIAPAVRPVELPVEASLDEVRIRADELTMQAKALFLAERTAEAEELYQQGTHPLDRMDRPLAGSPADRVSAARPLPRLRRDRS
jgi:hypothetical protein